MQTQNSTSFAHDFPTEQPKATAMTTPKAPLFRVLVADIIDRLVPLPFLVWLFPQWIVVVIAYHLLCDCSHNRRSFGKWLMRLRVVQRDKTGTCDFWRAALQRLGVTLTQIAWCLWWGIPFVLLYE